MNIRFDTYQTVIGLECHVQLLTESKLFSGGKNTFGHPVNTLVDVIDAGLPGVLPTLNQKVVEFAVKLGLALSCTINRESVFARKHYFYPDLPKGYQISQFDKPICEHGVLEYLVDGQVKSLRITRIHIEEDAGKNIHVDGSRSSYVDFNRAGTPLLEVVTEPDLRSPQEAMAAFKAIRQLVVHLGICDGNLEEGSLRADVNVSVMKHDATKFGTRTETKNLNSFRFLGQAISFESRRQIIELESGNQIKQETRLWDPQAKESRSLRSKEEAHDYRYFPDPDLLPLVLPNTLIDTIASQAPELPIAQLRRYQSAFGLNDHDALMLSSDKLISDYFETALSFHKNPKGIANWILNELLRSGKSDHDDDQIAFTTSITPKSLASLVKLIDDNKISVGIGKKVLHIMQTSSEDCPEKIIADHGWQVVDDKEAIASFVKQVLDENPEEVKKFHDGKTKVFGFLMGQLMKISKGQLDPKRAHDLMMEALRAH